MPRLKNPWCDEEIALLKDMHGCVSHRDIAHLLGRTKASVESKRRFLGLPSLYSVERSWSKDEHEFLLQNHRVLTNQQIADHLCRNKGAVRSRIKLFRLAGPQKLPRRWTEADDTYLLLAWEIDTLEEIARALGRTVPAVQTHVRDELKIRRSPRYYISIGHSYRLLPPELRDLITLNKKLKKGLRDAEHRRSEGAPLRGNRGAAKKSDGR